MAKKLKKGIWIEKAEKEFKERGNRSGVEGEGEKGGRWDFQF